MTAMPMRKQHTFAKMEEYEGMVILATNLVDQIDDAFRRRIKFMIPFPLPGCRNKKKTMAFFDS